MLCTRRVLAHDAMSRRPLAHDAKGTKKPPFLPLLEVDDYSSESPQQGGPLSLQISILDIQE